LFRETRTKAKENIFVKKEKWVVTTLFGKMGKINFRFNTKLKYAGVEGAVLKVCKAHCREVICVLMLRRGAYISELYAIHETFDS